jgi:hypothetical protein
MGRELLDGDYIQADETPLLRCDPRVEVGIDMSNVDNISALLP